MTARLAEFKAEPAEEHKKRTRRFFLSCVGAKAADAAPSSPRSASEPAVVLLWFQTPPPQLYGAGSGAKSPVGRMCCINSGLAFLQPGLSQSGVV